MVTWIDHFSHTGKASVILDVPIGRSSGFHGSSRISLLVKAKPEGVSDDELLDDEGSTEPGQAVLQGDQAHEIIVKFGVVPWAGVELEQDKACEELPGVGPECIDETANQNVAAVLELQVHALYDQDGRAVDEEGPDTGDARELPVEVNYKFPGSREHHLAEVAMDGVEVPAREHCQGFDSCHLTGQAGGGQGGDVKLGCLGPWEKEREKEDWLLDEGQLWKTKQ